MNWMGQNEGPRWIPVIHIAEDMYGIPKDLLCRVAYQESHFITAVIRGEDASPAGALGLMQLMPQYFPTVRRPIPFTDRDVADQIEEAAKFLQSLYRSTNDWRLALAAYDAGLRTVERYQGIPPFKETQDYVAEIAADVPEIENA